MSDSMREWGQMTDEANEPVGVVPIEFACDGVVTIRKCEEAKFPWGTAPAFWFLKRPMFTMDADGIGWPHEAIAEARRYGFDVAYWDGDKWATCCPKQFASPEEAMAEYESRVRPK